jgi:outer membrane receptor for ferrienterochelin and colicins
MKIKILALFILLSTALNAQISGSAIPIPSGLRGSIQDEKGQPIIGAHVFWMDKSAETTTDENGVFQLPRRTKERMVHVESIGFQMFMKTLKADENDLKIVLKEAAKELSTVQVVGKKGDNSVSSLNARNVETINSMELRKAPCCNLSESFETNGAVDVAYSDAITGAKEIQMLGLRGIYTQMRVENRPDFYGLAAPYALEMLPGTWLKSIQISKGVGSVINGMQAITGQINTELQQPGEDKPVFVNLYAEGNGRMEANLHLNKVYSEKYASTILLHGSTFQNKIDRHNPDGFVDMPLKKQLNAMWRNFYRDAKWESQLSFHGLIDDRQSGQILDNQTLVNPFKIDVRNERAQTVLKVGYLGFDKPYNSLGSQWSGTYHKVNALYGKNKYNGEQKSFYGNVIFATIAGTTDHKLSFGGSFQYDDFKEFLNDKNLSRVDALTGAFGEYTFNRPTLEGYNDWTVIASLRTDYHNRYGAFVTPRLNIKYNFNEGDVIRLVGGRGVRVANPIAENVAFLATNRAIDVAPDLKPEDAWNMGINFVKTLKFKDEREWRLNLDVYRTQFTNQIVTDLESDFNKAKFYNLTGQSYSNVFLAMLNADLGEGIHIKIAYKINDVKTTYNGKLAEVPLVAKQRGLVSFDWKLDDNKWMFNWTTQFIGQQRLADRSTTPPQYLHHSEPYSPQYYISNASINRFFKTFEVYGGVENMYNYTQHNPIIAASDPTSIYFDATQIYAPMMGRRIYAGLRWWINRK